MIHPYTLIGLGKKPHKRKIISSTVDNICGIIAESSGIDKDQIIERTRKREYVLARQMLHAILRKHYVASLTSIGRLVKRDHSTIILSLEMHECDYSTDKLYRKVFDYVEQTHLFW